MRLYNTATKYLYKVFFGSWILMSASILAGCRVNSPIPTPISTATPISIISSTFTPAPLFTERVTPSIIDPVDCNKADRQIDISLGTSVNFLPNASSIVLVSESGAFVYDIVTGEKTLAFTDNLSPNSLKSYHLISFSSDGTKIAYIDSQQIIVWDMLTAAMVQKLTLAHQTSEGPLNITYFSIGDGKHQLITFAWVEQPTLSKSWIINSCELYPSVPSICPGAISPDGKKIATFNSIEGISIFDVESLQLFTTLSDSQLSSNYSFSIDGRFILSLNYPDWSINIWDIADGELVAVINPNPLGAADGPILGLQKFSFSKDGTRLVTFQPRVRDIMIWDTNNWKLIHSIKACNDIGDVALSSDGKVIAALSREAVYIWNIEH